MTLPKWLTRRRRPLVPDHFTRERVKEMLDDAYQVGYTDGKREGIALSRQLAENQLRSILWQQNQNLSVAKTPTQRR